MKIKSIKNQKDYEDALKEIDRLYDAEEGTPEGDRLEKLSDLVAAYEEAEEEDDEESYGDEEE